MTSRIYASSPLVQDDVEVDLSELITQTYELAEECVKTNHYGAKKMTEAFLPLLQLSDSPRVSNITSGVGQLTV